MNIKIEGSTIDLNSKGYFKMALAYLNAKSRLILEKGDEKKAKEYLDQAFEVENEYRKFTTVNNTSRRI